MESLASLGPTWSITIDYSKENLAAILTSLSAKGLHAVTRPGHNDKTLYVLVKDDSNIVPGIVRELSFVKNTVPLPGTAPEQQRKLLTKKMLLSALLPSDDHLKELNQMTGTPETAFYMGFVKSYTRWLMALSVVGLGFRLFSKNAPWEFNMSFMCVVLIWSLLFIVFWGDRTEPSLLQHNPIRRLRSSSPGVPPSSVRSSFIKNIFFIPVAIQFGFLLIAFQFLCFCLEIFLRDIYAGPLKSYAPLLPTIFISVYTPILTAIYNAVIVRFVKWENSSSPEKSKMQKRFVLAFLTNYTPLFITLYVYLPLGYTMNDRMNAVTHFSSRWHIPINVAQFKINVGRYQDQYFYFTVMNQAIALFLENALPYIIVKVTQKLQDRHPLPSKEKVAKDYPEDLGIWEYVCLANRESFGGFDVNTLLTKYIIQFGFITMFSSIWPCAPLACVVFNVIALKFDIWRCLNKCSSQGFSQTDLPAESVRNIGEENLPWTSLLKFLFWISSFVSPSLVFMYKGPENTTVTPLFEKRETWLMTSPVQRDWRMVVVMAVIVEHLALLSFWTLSKIVQQPHPARGGPFIPAKNLVAPPRIDLGKVVEDSEKFMRPGAADSLPKRTKSTRGSDGLQKTVRAAEVQKGQPAENDIVQPAKIVISNDVKAEEKDDESEVEAMSKDRASDFSSSSSDERTEGSDARLPQSVEMSVSSSVAGATLPETIPTSKNYHLRHDGAGGDLKKEAARALEGLARKEAGTGAGAGSSTSKPLQHEHESKHVSSVEDQQVQLNKSSGASENKSKALGNQFVPQNLAQIPNNRAAATKVVESTPEKLATPVKTKTNEELKTPMKTRNDVSDRVSSIKSGNDSKAQYLETPKSSKHVSRSGSAKKMKKNVLGPLEKLKKKFP
ncbi:LAMI_0E09252g1_1 [Lachancea mirantina]|uniref:LAMI_0E09252g1_1 n=1 Tax=Lachancea mirantina TaxID=1230905 RepID=A0A1G4JNC8_9SACH|nr:LAMI_0E09252g1_1 [Lachancea mirantina]